MSPSSAKPPKNFPVELQVREGTTDNKEWNHVRIGGIDYQYRYKGGSKEHGNHEAYVGTGINILDIALIKDEQRYVIHGGECVTSTPKQFDFQRVSDLTATVTDLNTIEAEAKYIVMVRDKENENIIPCHPMMKNIPPP
jgi:hypothetical protein